MLAEHREDLEWWCSSMQRWNGRAVLPQPVQAQLVTDASHVGWGAHLQHHTTQGFWDSHMSNKHSNVREMVAVLLAMKAFRPFIAHKSVQVLSDNITTVAYINHMGGPIKELTNIAKQIWLQAFQYQTTITAKHLSGVLNVQADDLSRQTDKFEWMLSKPTFKMLDSMWGPHTVDRFASALSTQLPRYNSRYLDPNGMPVDALAQIDWAEENNFVNPPMRLLDRVLQIIAAQGAHATVIAPWWPAQTWFARLRAMAITTPVRIYKRAIVQLNPAVPEPLRNKRWNLYAWRICGNSRHYDKDGLFWQHREWN